MIDCKKDAHMTAPMTIRMSSSAKLNLYRCPVAMDNVPLGGLLICKRSIKVRMAQLIVCVNVTGGQE